MSLIPGSSNQAVYSNVIVNAKNLCVYYKPPAGCARIHKGIMPLCGVYPAQGTN